jgi:hypothetical protein
MARSRARLALSLALIMVVSAQGRRMEGQEAEQKPRREFRAVCGIGHCIGPRALQGVPPKAVCM